MANLYLTEQNSVLRKSGERLIVQKDDDVLLDVQCHKIDAVLIFGNVQFTTQAANALLEENIELAIFSRTGRLKGQITSPTTKNITLRIHQFEKHRNDGFRLNLSRAIVEGKITNALSMVRHFAYNHPELNFGNEKDFLHKAVKQVESADDLDRLRGIEGSAGRTYFEAFGKMLLAEFCFNGRNKQPPTDPINAILSLSYTMVFNEISSLLDGLGFDPYLGYFHSVEYGRPSLAADLIEEFRAPIADRLTLHLSNDRILKRDDFYVNAANGGMYLKRDALKRYFEAYEKMLNHEFLHPERNEKTTLRKCVRLQAEKLASTIMNDTAYHTFRMVP